MTLTRGSNRGKGLGAFREKLVGRWRLCHLGFSDLEPLDMLRSERLRWKYVLLCVNPGRRRGSVVGLAESEIARR